MDEKIKTKILIGVIVLMLGFLVMAVISNQTVGRVKQDLDQERFKRMTAEENLNKANMKIGALESELMSTQDKIQSVQTILRQGKSETTDLKTQLESMTKTKETLEKKIDELKTTAMIAPTPESPAPNPAPTP